MPVAITIRNVPEHVRDELATRAARRGQSMQAYLLAELKRIASEPSIDEWLEGVRERKAGTANSVTRAAILEARDADRT